jgi:heme-degrading monooxygenase HmoA
MSQPIYTTGSWKPLAGHEPAFLEAWKEFMDWATGLPGAGEAVLARDLRDTERFVSFAAWESMEAVRGWKDSPEFKPRMSKVQQHIDKFAPTELDVVVSVGGSQAPRSARTSGARVAA